MVIFRWDKKNRYLSSANRTFSAMAKQPNDWYLNGIKNRDGQVLKAIYESYFPMVKGFLLKNSGTVEDAKDVFADALMSLFEKLRKEELVLTCSFSTYLFEICKRLWLKKLRRKKFDAGVTPEELKVSNVAVEMEPVLEKTERHQLLREKFAELSEDCQKVLHLSWHTEKDMREIGAVMGWTYAYVRKRKHQCKEALIQKIKQDVRFGELSNK